MSTVEPRLVVTIDTECDKSRNWRTASPLTFRGVTEAIPQRLQPLFARFGIRPTYLLSPEVMLHPESVTILEELKDVELTTHLHGDYIVPQIKTWNFAGSITDEMQWEYGAGLERAKMASLTEMFRQQFGRQPLSFRAGRFGAGPHTGKILQDLGYTVDSSVTPHICWTSRKGEKRPDYRNYLELPYTLGAAGDIAQAGVGGLLELPVTVLPTGAVMANNPGEPIWFRPWYSDADTLCRVLDHVLAQPVVDGVHRPLVMMFHNVELLAGASPYPQTDSEVQRYLDMMARVFERAEKRGVKACTMAEYQAYYAHCRRPTAAPPVEGPAPLVLRSCTLQPQLRLDAMLVADTLDRHNVQSWFKYIFSDRVNRWDCWRPCVWLAQNVPTTAPILSLGTGVGFNLLWLAEQGFTQLHGTDIDPKAIAAGSELAAASGLPVVLAVDDALAPKAFRQGRYAAIEALNWCHLLEGFTLDRLLDLYEPLLNEEGVFIIDAIDSAYDEVPDNQYCTQDRNKPVAERRPSEYRTRMSESGVREAFARHGLSIVEIIQEPQAIPKRVYIAQRTAAAQAAGRLSGPAGAQPEAAANSATAEQMARQGLAENSRDLAALKLLLSVCLDTARWTEGIDVCNRICEQTPDDVDVLRALTYCLQEAGNSARAGLVTQRIEQLASSQQPTPPSAPLAAPTPVIRAPGAKRPRVLLIADVPNWIFARHCRMLERFLGDRFDFTLQFQGTPVAEDDFDLIYPLEWNLVPFSQIRTPAKYVTGIRSHLSWRGQDFLPFADALGAHFQRVHVVSHRLQEMFAPFLPTVAYVTHGVDTGFFTAQTRSDQSGHGKLRIGWAGNRVNRTKGFEEYVAPLAQLPGVELLFCGFKDKNLNVELMREFYDSLDVYVCASSLHHEGNNNSLMEAASMQRAIITTDNGTVPEYLRRGDNAIIVERELPNFIRAVVELRDNPAKRVALGERARQAVCLRFEWQAMAEHYAAFFEAALAGRDQWHPDAAAGRRSVQPRPASAPQATGAGPDLDSQALLQTAARAIETLDWSTARSCYQRVKQLSGARDHLGAALDETLARLTDLLQCTAKAPAIGDSPTVPDGISFCIITNGKRPEKLRREIESIRALRIPQYEILVGGDVPTGLGDVRIVSVPDAARNGRLGEMRNRLTEQARFEHLVVADDDVVFLPDFFDGLCRFGDDYDVLCVRFLNPNGSRYWDWATNDGPRGHALLSYDETDAHVYVTGGLCIMKAHVARRVKWDETLGYYKGEDTEFSGRLRAARVSIKFNPHSTVIHHDPRFTQLGKVVVPVEGLQRAARDHLRQGQQAEAAMAFALLALLAPESVRATHAAEPVAEGPLPSAVQALLDEAAKAFQGGDLRAVHESLQRALQEAPDSRSVREAAADATRALRESIPVADLSGHVRPTRLNIALLTRDDLEHTQRCLASLRRHTAEPLNVFVVDNGSTDGTREWFTQQGDSNLFVEFSPVDLGVTGGRNRLLQFLRPHLPDDGFVIFLSSGIEVLPGWTEHFDNFLAANPQVGLAAANGHRFALLGDDRELGEVLVETPTAVDMASFDSGCWVRAAALKAIGNFDEGLGRLWHGDDDFSVRALAAGWDVYVVPSAPLLRFPPKSAAAKLAAAQDNSPATQRYLVNRWRALGLLGANGQIQRPAARRPLEAVPARTSLARVSIPVRWGGPIFNPSGYASEAISFILPLSYQLNLGILHDNNLTSRKHFEELPVAERDRLLALHEKCSRMRGGIYISHNPAHGFRRTPDAIYHIGRTMYETDRIPPSWVSQCNMMDEIWVPSHFNVETFAYSGVAREKLVVMPGAVDEDLFDPAKHQPLPLPNAAKFNFVSVFEWSDRKAWDVLLAAYLREFSAEDDVCLHLRTYLFSRPDGDPSDVLKPLIRDFTASLNLGNKPLPRIELLSQQLATQELPRLYMAADCLVVPSRGEGWGRPMHEAMAMGRPVIATNWSANTEFMNAENSYLVDYELVDVKNTEPQLRHYLGHRWAHPSERHLRETMRHVRQHPAEALAKGAKARDHVTKLYSRAAVTELVMRQLETIERKFTTPACPAIVARASSVPTEHQYTRAGSIPVVAWEGSFLDHGSLSHVNRELTAALDSSAGIRLTRVNPSESGAQRPEHPVARDIRANALATTQITVRHSWPPVWEKPKSGKWVQLQPWEFGSLPKNWAAAAAHTDEIWAYSTYVRDVYVTGGIDPRKVKVVPLGIDPQRFQPKATPRSLATRKRFKFLFVGGTIQRKGPDILLAAYVKSFTAADDVCLVIKDFGGSGVYAGQTLEAQIKSIQAQADAPEILYLNEELPPEALPSLYTACDCLVHPYRGEGFGLPVLEAMACGLPVIVTGGGSTDDFATDEFAFRIPAVRRAIPKRIAEFELITRGWVLEPALQAVAERMRWVFAHPTEARTTGLSASAHVRKEWTWQRAANVALGHLRNLATSTSTPEPASKGTTVRKLEGAPLPSVAVLGSLTSAEELLRKKSPRAAWDAAYAAIQQRPFHPEAWLLLGEAARMAGNAATARRCAEQALRLAPALTAAKKFLKHSLNGAAKHDWLVLPKTFAAGSMAAPRLSVCLIVKNEEQFLGQCLASVKGLADQIVIVDTGSNDRTIEIAREHGAEVHSFTWCDDFSAARNAALAHATGDWVLVLDADEEIPAPSHAQLREHLRDTAVMAWRLPIVDAGREEAGHSYVPRLFRNAPGVFFAGRVHEHAFGVVEQLRKAWGLENRLGEALIVHHGYTKALTENRDKVARNLRLLELALQESPNNVSLLMSLGLELCRSKRFDEGLLRYFEAFTLLAAQPANAVVPELRETLLTQFASYLHSAKRHSEVAKVLASPLAKQTRLTASQSYVLGMAQIEQEHFAEAAESLRVCLAHRTERSLMPALPEVRSAAPRRALALCLWRLKDFAAADKEFQQALAEDPQGPAVYTEYARFLSETGRTGDALQLLHKIASEKPELAPVWICGAQLALSQPDLLEVGLDWTAVAVQHLPENDALIELRAETLLLSGAFQEALPLWQRREAAQQPRALAALVLCAAASNATPYTPQAALVPAIEREFMLWFQRLVQFNAQPAILQLLQSHEALARVLPTSGRILSDSVKELAAATS